MTFTNEELGAILILLEQHPDWSQLSNVIHYDAQKLHGKVFSQLSSQTLYDLDCY